MKVSLLVATTDEMYAKSLSDNISEHYANLIDISVCSTISGLDEVSSKRTFNVVLFDTELIEYAKTEFTNLPLVLWSENCTASEILTGYGRIHKHQRISLIVAAILERYAKISKTAVGIESKYANITAVWSPAGGVGKTSVAVAYAKAMIPKDDMTHGKEIFYLNLEDFSAVPVYFKENGKSISTVFEMLESRDGNAEMLIQGICCREKGIAFLSSPDNYDDMSILSSEIVHELITSCAKLADELIIDLSCACDTKVKKAFELAGRILIVSDGTTTAEAKITQFIIQNNIHESIKEKVTFVANKDAVINRSKNDMVISLPLVQSNDAIYICKALSGFLTSEGSRI